MFVHHLRWFAAGALVTISDPFLHVARWIAPSREICAQLAGREITTETPTQ